MKNPRFQGTAILAVICVSWGSVCSKDTSGLSEPPPVIHRKPYEWTFTVRSVPPDPFEVDLKARVNRPDGSSLSVLGFYDGENNWKLRLYIDQKGDWRFTIQSDLPELDGRQVRFTCPAAETDQAPGALLIDAGHPHHFVYENGARCFLLGYECDWLWALDMGDPDLPTLNPFLDKLASFGFNHILMNAYAHDTSWRKGKTEEQDYGPPPLFPWEGTNETPDHSRFNLDYWHHYDRVIEALFQRGIIAHIMIKVYNKYVNWPKPGSVEDDRYFKWLIARYAAYPNVVWDFSKEAFREANLDYKLSRLHLIRKHDPFRRLVTVHDDDLPYEQGVYRELVDFRSDQQHSNWHGVILKQRKTHDSRPVVNVEFGYEQGIDGAQDKTYQVVQSPEEMCKRAWEIVMAGGYPVYYYTNTAWDVIRTEETPEGYRLFGLIRQFFSGTRYWEMEPRGHLVSGGYCLAGPGELIIYSPDSAPFSLRIEKSSKTWKGTWFHPLTGTVVPEVRFDPENPILRPPEQWKETPSVLHLVSIDE